MAMVVSDRQQVRALHPALGAEVRGVDMRRRLDADTFQAVHDAWMQHLVLVFPAQHITDFGIDQMRCVSTDAGQASAKLIGRRRLAGHRQHVMAQCLQFLSDQRRQHLVQQEFNRRMAACPAVQAACASAASCSLAVIHSSISSV